MTPGRGPRWRPRSLFWTFAGAFLAVVAVAAAVQAWALSALSERLAEEQASSRAQRPAFDAGVDLAAASFRPEPLGPILHDHGAPDGTYFLVYRSRDGDMALPWPAERAVQHRLARFVETGVDAWGLDPAYDAAFGPAWNFGHERGARPGHRPEQGLEPRRPPGPRRRPDGPAGAGPPGDGDPRAGFGDRPWPPRPGAPRPPRRRHPGGGPVSGEGPVRDMKPFRAEDLPAPGLLRELTRIPVQDGGTMVGHVVAIHPVRRHVAWHQEGVPALMLLPVALLLATAAGLGLFLLLTGRLRRLERMAARIASGDLAARVADPGHDEIGRLGGELNSMAASLERAREELEAAGAERRRLLADISHELATPLTSIRGYAETLLDADLPLTGEERREYLDHVLDEARRMELLLGDLFELTRLEAGMGSLECERLDWTALCRHTVDRYVPRFAQADLDLRFEGGSEPVWIDADGRRMEQVLENLLTNAMRYVPAGGRVWVAVRRADDGADTGALLAVADDGPGFPEEDLPHVFDRFYRSEANAQVPGSGLGLAIVQEIVERHGGRVEAANGVGGDGERGAVLRVVLPTLA